ncbi:probable hexokinase-like 2 protein isoform X2 [Punica granatum]|uniref:Phosphotransferase n=1 Tax=Punica granatum TaxID=22663 RepID=A0A6P8CPW9_PUNGR|nr:probable hexokinase-like 2 protein isoform X2 [Punica granatum]
MVRREVVVAVLTTAAAIVAATTVLWRLQGRRQRQRERAQRILRKFARESATPVPLLWRVADALASNMDASLSTSTDQKSSNSTLNMLVASVDSLPTGEEEGIYYGVNLKSKDFLLLSARLGGKKTPISDLHRQEISFPSHVLSSTTSQEVFDFVASKVAEFVAGYPGDKTENSKVGKGLGFTISYPVGHAATEDNSASGRNTAIKWKSFLVDDPVQDQKQLLGEINSALKKHGVDMQTFALVIDPAGDLAGGRYYSQDCVAAVTLGTGTSAAYTELAESVPRPRWLGVWPKSGEILVTMGWGNFSCSDLPITEFDSCLDAESSNPGSQIFEKLISGTYLGETVRRVLLKMAQETLIFGKKVSDELKTPYVLSSSDMAAMHQDTSEDREITDTTSTAREIVAEVCDIVAERGARLAAAGIVGIIKKLKRINDRKSIVTIEGELYEHYRVFRNYLHSSMWEMLGKELSDNIVIEHSHGGSGSGAIFLAATQQAAQSTVDNE